MPGQDETLLRFPCRFPIKAMGLAQDDIESVVVDIIRRHAPGTPSSALKRRPSRSGKWVSVTVLIQAHSKSQLDAIYQELSDHAHITCAF